MILNGHYTVPIVLGILSVILGIREYVTYRKILALKYLFTPLVTCSIIVISLMAVIGNTGSVYNLLVFFALLSSLVADTLLMIEEVNLLRYGIVFFLLAHIIYIFAFSAAYSFHPVQVPVFIVISFLAFQYIRKLRLDGGAGRLFIPVVVYILIVSLMAFTAFSYLPHNFDRQSILRALGAFLFLLSDSLLGINAFIKPIPHSSVFTWATYAPAQTLIVLSCF